MKIYWFKAQAPQRVLALVKYLGIKAELIEVDMMKGRLATPEYVVKSTFGIGPVNFEVLKKPRQSLASSLKF